MIAAYLRMFSHWPLVSLLILAWIVVEGQSTEAASSSRPAARSAPSAASGSVAQRAGIGGSWVGRYQCAQGWTGFELTITELGQDRIAAEFSFFPLPGNPGVPSGRFMMQGSFDPHASRLSLAPGQWLERPRGYRGVGLDGRLDAAAGRLAGRVAPGCGDFELARKQPERTTADVDDTADPEASTAERRPASPAEAATADDRPTGAVNAAPPAGVTNRSCTFERAARRYDAAAFHREFEETKVLFDRRQLDQAWVRSVDLICSGKFPIGDKVGAFDGAFASVLTGPALSQIAVAPGELRRNLERTSVPSLSDEEDLALFLFAILALGHEGDSCTGARLLFLPALNGHPHSQLMLGQAVGRGGACGWGADAVEAAYWYEKAAAGGSAAAMVRLAAAHLLGSGVPKDLAKASALLRQVADTADPEAKYLLAMLLASGQFHAADPTQEARLFREAAEAGHAAAQVMVGETRWQQATELFLNTTGTDQQTRETIQQIYREAIGWFRKAAEQGSGEGQYRLARAYLHYREYDQAIAWYEAAAQQGHAGAQFWLGHWYWQGGVPRHPVTKDDELAVRWFRPAAERGHALAQTYLGWAYVGGRGVAQDDAEGVAWFTRGASANEARAEEALAWAYKNGRGVPKDLARSRMWNRRAASHGSESAARQTPAGQLRRLAINTVGGADVLHAILGMRAEGAADAGASDQACDMTVGFSCNAGVDLLGASIWMSIQ